MSAFAGPEALKTRDDRRMDLKLNPADLAFRDEVRAFLDDHLTPISGRRPRPNRAGAVNPNVPPAPIHPNIVSPAQL